MCPRVCCGADAYAFFSNIPPLGQLLSHQRLIGGAGVGGDVVGGGCARDDGADGHLTEKPRMGQVAHGVTARLGQGGEGFEDREVRVGEVFLDVGVAFPRLPAGGGAPRWYWPMRKPPARGK